MSTMCARCGTVFASNIEYKNHRCEVALVPREEVITSNTSADTQQHARPKSTKGLSIADRLASVLPIGDLNSGGDDTPLVHDSQTQFQNAMLHLAKHSNSEGSIKIFPHDVRAILRGVHLLCDRIEGGVR